MAESFLTNTSTEGLKPLGTAPQRSYELVSGTVRSRLGDAHAALFAEPVATQYGDRFDWYAPVEGKAVPLSAMDAPDDARAVLDNLVSDINTVAEELLASKSPDDQRLGEALANAVEIPDEAAIFVVEPAKGGALQPVLVNWAWVRDEQVAVRGVLTGIDRRAPEKRPGHIPQPAPAMAATVAGVSAVWWWLVWLGWLLLGLIIAAIIYLLIEPCALRVSWLPNLCAKVEVIPDTIAEERSMLEDRIAMVQQEIWIKDRLCQPDFALLPIPEPDDLVPPVTSVQPSLPIDPEVDNRALAAGAARGDLSFTLIWEGTDDLDLYTTCPSNETLFFLNKARCNGVMDVDVNGFQIVPNPVENTYFTDPLPGAYRVRVHMYRPRDGDRVTTQKGSVSASNRSWHYVYEYGKK
jgi:hypothetical protein